jgi:hypothetical protein
MRVVWDRKDCKFMQYGNRFYEFSYNLALILCVLLKQFYFSSHLFFLEGQSNRKNEYSFYQEQMGSTVRLLLDNSSCGRSFQRTWFASVLHVCLLKYHYLLSRVISGTYNGAKLMKVMQRRRDHVMIVQCKQNSVFQCVFVVTIVTRLQTVSQRNRASIPGRTRSLFL